MKNGKFKRLYRFQEPQHVISTIASRKLKISLFDELNNPHELLGAHLQIPGFEDLTEFLIERNKRKMGVLCWCRSYSRAVMWAHYACRHKGVALGFDVSANQLKKVNYTAAPVLIEVDLRMKRALEKWRNREIKFSMKLAKDIDPYLRDVFATKNDDWAYEEEWRSFTTITDKENGLYFKPFRPGLYLREVILGLRCDLSIKDIQTAIVGLPGEVKILCAAVQDQSFELVAEEIDAERVGRPIQNSASNYLPLGKKGLSWRIFATASDLE